MSMKLIHQKLMRSPYYLFCAEKHEVITKLLRLLRGNNEVYKVIAKLPRLSQSF